MAHVVDTADELGTVLFGYARCSHVAVDHSSDMDGRGSLLITANKLHSLKFVDVLAQLYMFNCGDNYIVFVLYICYPKKEVL